MEPAAVRVLRSPSWTRSWTWTSSKDARAARDRLRPRPRPRRLAWDWTARGLFVLLAKGRVGPGDREGGAIAWWGWRLRLLRGDCSPFGVELFARAAIGFRHMTGLCSPGAAL